MEPGKGRWVETAVAVDVRRRSDVRDCDVEVVFNVFVLYDDVHAGLSGEGVDEVLGEYDLSAIDAEGVADGSYHGVVSAHDTCTVASTFAVA